MKFNRIKIPLPPITTLNSKCNVSRDSATKPRQLPEHAAEIVAEQRTLLQQDPAKAGSPRRAMKSRPRSIEESTEDASAGGRGGPARWQKVFRFVVVTSSRAARQRTKINSPLIDRSRRQSDIKKGLAPRVRCLRPARTASGNDSINR